MTDMRTLIAALASAALAACAVTPDTADPLSDAPETRFAAASAYTGPASYPDALQTWKSAGEVNAWIGAKFQYDLPRAMRLSETQRQKDGRIPIHAPSDFFAAPSGVCVDLARFGVETLRAIEPGAKPAYLMIEFDPAEIRGNTLRRHWVTTFEREGQHYFFADSKRPGVLSGPYASPQAFIDEYASYRGRRIVSFRATDTYERRMRTPAARQPRVDGQDAAK